MPFLPAMLDWKEVGRDAGGTLRDGARRDRCWATKQGGTGRDKCGMRPTARGWTRRDKCGCELWRGHGTGRDWEGQMWGVSFSGGSGNGRGKCGVRALAAGFRGRGGTGRGKCGVRASAAAEPTGWGGTRREKFRPVTSRDTMTGRGMGLCYSERIGPNVGPLLWARKRDFAFGFPTSQVPGRGQDSVNSEPDLKSVLFRSLLGKKTGVCIRREHHSLLLMLMFACLDFELAGCIEVFLLILHVSHNEGLHRR